MSAANESGRFRPNSRFGEHQCPLSRADPSSDQKTQMTASLIGLLGQARFPCCLGSLSLIRVTLLFAVCLMARGTSLHTCVGLAVESLALRRA